jgi:2-succinyl-6-hydroxy-2,4-cyclohexadiene-1-carboxylate synthase
MARLNAIISNQINGESGAPLVFFHGFLGSSADWSAELDWITSNLRRSAIAIDLPGHGGSLLDDPSEYDWDRMVDSIWETIDADHRFAGKKVVMFGYSMGGRCALGAAFRRPERINRVVLISSAPGIDSSNERSLRAKWDLAQANLLRSLPLPNYIDQWYSQSLFNSLNDHPELKKKIMDVRSNNSPNHLAMSLVGMGRGRQPSYWPDVVSAPFPIHLLLGDDDAGYKATGYEMERLGCFVHRINNAGHYVHREKEFEFKQWLYEVIK